MFRRTAVLLLCGFFLDAPSLGASETATKVNTVEGVTEYRLTNGLRILLVPDSSKPLVSVHCTVMVGSRHEGYGETGMAHLLEHMLIKGTPTHPDIAKSLRDRGARFNATTWVDRTNFFETLPASDDNLEFAIKLEADRLVNSFIKREELLTEMTVVRNEFEMRENDPENVLLERMTAAAFRWHNYGKAVIGNKADIERVPVESLQAFYKKHYRVDNATLVVAGRFEEVKALAHVAKYFGALKKPAQKLPPTYTQEPAQDGERHVSVRRVGSVGVVGVVYHIPAASHPDYPAIQVLADCLLCEPGGRLHKALVESKKASGIAGRAREYHDPGLIELTAKVEDPSGIDAARDALIQSLESIGEKPFTQEEVTRSQQRFRKLYETVMVDAELLAATLDEYAAVGDWRLLFLERDLTEKVTAADVNRVAQKYLTRNNRTIGVFHPMQKAERIEVPEAPDLAKRLEGFAGRAVAASGEAFDPTPENIEKRVVRGTLGPIKTAFLPKSTRGELAHIQLHLRYGNERSLAGLTMAAELLPDMLMYGTKRHNRQQLADEVSKLEGRVSIGGGAGVLTVSVTAKKANLPALLKLVAEMLREPAFPETDFATLKAEVLTALASQKAEPGSLAVQAVVRKLKAYPMDDVRYVATTAERIERVKSTTLDQVKAVYEKQLGAQVGELAAVGEFDPAVLTAGLEPALSGWKNGVPFEWIGQPARPHERGDRFVIETPDKANAVYYAALSYPQTDSDMDYAAIQLGTFLLGGDPFTSRLGKRVRKDNGLSYDIRATFTADAIDKAAMFELSAITNPVNMGKVGALIAEELNKFITDGVSPEELAAAKKSCLEVLKVALTDDAVLASRLANGLFLGRTLQFNTELARKLETVTAEDIQRAFGRVVDPKKLVIAEAGDFAKAKIGKESPMAQK